MDIFHLSLEGDSTGGRVESALTDIALNFSTTFVTMQVLYSGIIIMSLFSSSNCSCSSHSAWTSLSQLRSVSLPSWRVAFWRR